MKAIEAIRAGHQCHRPHGNCLVCNALDLIPKAAEEMRIQITNLIADSLQASAQLIKDIDAIPLPGDEPHE